MTRIRFEDLPSTNTPRNAENLNKLNNVVISPTEPTTGEEVWIQKSKNLFNINGSYIQQTGSPTISGNSISLPSSEGNGGYTKFEQKIEVNSPIVLSFVTSNGGGHGRPLLMPLDSDGNIITDLTIDGYTYLNGYGGYYKDYADGRHELALSFPERVKYLQLGFIHINATFTNIQIERGETATDYEPYVDKKILVKNHNGVYEEFYKDNSEVVLYDNENGSNTTITLSDNVSNYKSIEIEYQAEQVYDSTKVFNPNEKYVTLQINVSFDVDNYYKNSRWQFKDNKIVYLASNAYRLGSKGFDDFTENINQVHITKVIGYKN